MVFPKLGRTGSHPQGEARAPKVSTDDELDQPLSRLSRRP